MHCSWENTAASIKTVPLGLVVLLHHMHARLMQTRRMGLDAATCMHAQHSWVNSLLSSCWWWSGTAHVFTTHQNHRSLSDCSLYCSLYTRGGALSGCTAHAGRAAPVSWVNATHTIKLV